MDPDNLTLRELVKSYADQTMCFPDDDDSEFVLSLHDGLSDEQLATLQEAWPFTIPLEYLDLLRFSSGFENSPLESFDFDVNPESNFQELIPCGIRIATDGFGNDWVLELRRDTESIGPVWYRCHDAPVFLFQSHTLSEFIIETFKMCMGDGQSLVNVVHEEKVCGVWENDPCLLRVAD
ncbi:MAG: SMI1/KNR4 family protein, partial [Candidatus Hydrogenedentota bacterium]